MWAYEKLGLKKKKTIKRIIIILKKRKRKEKNGSRIGEKVSWRRWRRKGKGIKSGEITTQIPRAIRNQWSKSGSHRTWSYRLLHENPSSSPGNNKSLEPDFDSFALIIWLLLVRKERREFLTRRSNGDSGGFDRISSDLHSRSFTFRSFCGDQCFIPWCCFSRCTSSQSFFFSFLEKPKLMIVWNNWKQEEIEIESKALRVGKAVAVVSVELRKKKTAKIIAQGRHTKYFAPRSNIWSKPSSFQYK